MVTSILTCGVLVIEMLSIRLFTDKTLVDIHKISRIFCKFFENKNNATYILRFNFILFQKRKWKYIKTFGDASSCDFIS